MPVDETIDRAKPRDAQSFAPPARGRWGRCFDVGGAVVANHSLHRRKVGGGGSLEQKPDNYAVLEALSFAQPSRELTAPGALEWIYALSGSC